MSNKLKNLVGSSPRDFPIIFNENVETIEKSLKDLTISVDEIKMISNNIRLRINEINDSKVGKDEMISMATKLNDLYSKIVTLKKENLKINKSINREKTLKTKTNLVSMKNSDQLGALYQEVANIEKIIDRKVKDIKNIDNNFDQSIVEEIVNKKSEELRKELTTKVKTPPVLLDNLILEQLKKQLLKNEKDIQVLQESLNEKDNRINELENKINNLG